MRRHNLEDFSKTVYAIRITALEFTDNISLVT